MAHPVTAVVWIEPLGKTATLAISFGKLKNSILKTASLFDVAAIDEPHVRAITCYCAAVETYRMRRRPSLEGCLMFT